MFAPADIDVGDQAGKGDAALRGFLLQHLPERGFESDRRPVTLEGQGALDQMSRAQLSMPC